MNITVLKGNLCKDPESRSTSSGKTVCVFTIAHNKKRGQEEKPIFVKVEAWGKQGELCQQYLKKGAQVTVAGEVDLEEWEKDGVKRAQIKITADKVDFGPKSGGQHSAPQEQPREVIEREPAPRQAQRRDNWSTPETSYAAPQDGRTDDSLPF